MYNIHNISLFEFYELSTDVQNFNISIVVRQNSDDSLPISSIIPHYTVHTYHPLTTATDFLFRGAANGSLFAFRLDYYQIETEYRENNLTWLNQNRKRHCNDLI